MEAIQRLEILAHFDWSTFGVPALFESRYRRQVLTATFP
jgi:hypothetical protein